jgi:TonB family protein
MTRVSAFLLGALLFASPARAQRWESGLAVDVDAITRTGDGAFDTAVLVTAIDEARPALRVCHDRQIRGAGPSGLVTVALTIAGPGAPRGVRATANTTGSAPLAACIVRVLHALRLPTGSVGGAVRFAVPIRFEVHPGDMVARTWVPATPALVRARIDEPILQQPSEGDFDPTSIVRMLATRRAAVVHCYESRATTTPGLGDGRVVLQFTIGESGRTTGARVVESTLPDPAVGECLVRMIVGLRFNPGAVDGDVTYAVPLVFERIPPP